MMHGDDLTPQTRAALVTWHIAHGRSMTTREVAELTGATTRGALAIMTRLAHVLPIWQDGRIWRLADDGVARHRPPAAGLGDGRVPRAAREAR